MAAFCAAALVKAGTAQRDGNLGVSENYVTATEQITRTARSLAPSAKAKTTAFVDFNSLQTHFTSKLVHASDGKASPTPLRCLAEMSDHCGNIFPFFNP